MLVSRPSDRMFAQPCRNRTFPLPDVSLSVDLLLTVGPEVRAEEAALIEPHYRVFTEHLPREFWFEYEALVGRLAGTSSPAMPRK